MGGMGRKVGTRPRAGKRNARLYRTDCRRPRGCTRHPPRPMRPESRRRRAARHPGDRFRRAATHAKPSFRQQHFRGGRVAPRRAANDGLGIASGVGSAAPVATAEPRAHRFPAPPARAPCRPGRGPLAACAPDVAVRRDRRAHAAARDASLHVMCGVRAYVTAESVWSNAQKIAVRSLGRTRRRRRRCVPRRPTR